MKHWLAVAACVMAAASAPALAQDKAKAPTEKQKAQQDRMKACSKEASDKKLKGDERKKFMSTCMKG
jgi:hypothetical protein